MRSIASALVSVVLVALMLVITPLYYVSLIDYAKSSSIALSATRDLIDTVIDTRQLSDETLADYNLQLAGASEYYNATIIRKVLVVNPDPSNPGHTYSTYMVQDDITTYNQGDKICVHVEPIGDGLFQILARSFLGLDIDEDGFWLSGRVR